MTYEPPAASATPSSPTEIPLWAPYYGATMKIAVTRFFKKYADFSGRASRSEYWWLYLAYEIVAIVLTLISFALILPTFVAQAEAVRQGVTPTIDYSPALVIFSGILFLFWLALLVPLLSLTWRRLHDTNRSGAFFFLSFIPWVGGIIVLVFTILAPDPAGARFDRPR